LALDDRTRAADLFRPIYEQTNGVNGWVSLEVSPLLAYDPAKTLAAAKDLFARAGRPNLFIKINLNGYKINNPTLLARISHEEIENLFKGYGYTPYFVEGSMDMDQAVTHCRKTIF
jgi:hypothetical protein